MIKGKLRVAILILMCLVGISGFSCMAQAEGISDYSSNNITIYENCALENEKTTIRWNPGATIPSGSTATFTFDVELADNKQFVDAKQYSTNLTSLTLDQSAFGDNGGRFYVRIRVVTHVEGDATIKEGDWCAPVGLVFVKINQNNFPGMYNILKNGGKYNSTDGVKKITYDKNKDGWLDPAEVSDATILGTTDVMKKVNGTYKLNKAPNISSFKGVEYLENLHIVSVDRFSGKKADLSKCLAYSVRIGGVSARQITVIAPNAKMVSVQPTVDAKVTKVDVSKCKSAVDILAYGNEGTKTVKLPKSKDKLKVLSLSEYGFKSINLNGYTNLEQVYFYECDMRSVKVNKCKKLRYIYFYYCDNIKGLNLKSNSKLRGADFYKTPGLTESTVKKSKSGKYTWNKGKWWYGTKAYQKDMKRIYK